MTTPKRTLPTQEERRQSLEDATAFAFKDEEARRRANAEKTARLRALRLASRSMAADGQSALD